MIKIGITPSFLYPDVNRVVYGPKTLTYVESEMVEYLTRPGVTPVLILDFDDSRMRETISELDGIIFAGGSDVHPSSYGEPHLNEKLWPGDLYRDNVEIKIFELSREKRLPLLGICRGFQVINVCMGGTLFQDMLTECENALVHRDAKIYDQIHHPISFVEGGILERIYGHVDEPYVNSVHHQGIKTLGKGLIPEAYSSKDVLLEGYSASDMSDHFILGIQWHPEFHHTLGEKVIDPNLLYDYFLKTVDARKP
jgi:putative glutamine amidotransferase